MKRLLPLLVLTIFTIAAPAVAIDLDELLEQGADHNGETVELTGELVGDYSVRSDGVWVQLNVDAYVDAPVLETGQLAGTNTGMGAHIPLEVFDESWGAPGGYRQRGPIVSITAVFRYHDPALQGDTYLDVVSVSLVETSRPLSEETPKNLLGLGIAALVAAFLLHFGTEGIKLIARKST
jgi:hypothetical protein